MYYPDVTAILDDPEVGGGVDFIVERKSMVRNRGTFTIKPTTFSATGNIQPVEKGFNQLSPEDQKNEQIVIRTTFVLLDGSHNADGVTGTDEVIYQNKRYRVTKVNNWEDWGFVEAYATRVRENQSSQ